ncbi:MAG: tetratricopeptide repeat protein [Sedimentisphaerales bacterium]|nr:tetratricopeptide repeat protein [Sedimentisphaerales bacterium]
MRLECVFILFFMAAVVCVPDCFGATMKEQDLYSLFRQANDAFRQANNSTDDPEAAGQLYQEAILGYESIMEQGGIRNAGLFYNLANAYLLRDDIGRAILNYRRALALDPTDPEIQKNLMFARSQRVDQVQIRARKKVLQRLFFWHYDFSARSRFVVACASFACFCLALTVRIWWPGVPGTVVLSVITGILSMCMSGSVALDQYVESHFRSGVILAELVTARQGDGASYAEAFKEPLHAGSEFDLIEQRAGWWHIELADGKRAWIPDKTAELI